jgi:alpha-amylase
LDKRFNSYRKRGKKSIFKSVMDYETFGEHQWKESGIFEFIKNVVELLLKERNIAFLLPSEVGYTLNYKPKTVSVPEPTLLGRYRKGFICLVI